MNSLKKTINLVLPLFIVGLLISDFTTSMVYKFSLSSFYRYSGMYKLLFEVIMTLCIIAKFKKLELTHKILIAIIGFFIIGQFLTYSTNYDIIFHFVKGNIYYLNRYLYILIFVLFLQSFEIERSTYLKAYTYLEAILLINVLLIVLGMIFDINVFKSYESTQRFGYVGLFSKPEEAGFIYGVTIICNYYLWQKTKKKRQLLKTIIFILTICLLGQKKMYLFIGLIITIHLLFQTRYKAFFRIIIPFFALVFVIFSKQFFRQLIEFSPFWSRVYSQKGLMSTITSTRSDLLNDALLYMKNNWHTANYIFGSINFSKYKVEFEFFDLYILIGVAGFLFYFFILKFYFLNTKDSLKNKLILTIFITSFFSGGLLLSVTATLILYVVSNKILDNKYA